MSLCTVRLTIPWAALASSNQRNRRRGGRAHSKAYTTSRAAIGAIVAVALRGQTPAFSGGAVSVRVRFYPPDYRRRDESNYCKVLLDAMNGLAYRDDSQVRDLSSVRADVDEENPRAEVEIAGEVGT